jgi:hypothetical protein
VSLRFAQGERGCANEELSCRFFYALISLMNIVPFIRGLTERRQGQSLKEALKASLWYIARCLVIIPKGIVLILLGISWWLPENMSRCLPLCFKWRVRFGRRYTWKSMLGLEQNPELSVTELKEMYKEHREKKIPRYQGGAGQVCAISNFIGTYDTLMLGLLCTKDGEEVRKMQHFLAKRRSSH